MPACPQCAANVPLAQRFCGSCGSPVPASSEAGTVAMSGAGARPARTSTPAPERFAPGTILAQRYRVAGRVGRGGMGEVYRAYDLILGQDVALKFLPADWAANPAALDRFRNEVRLARQVSHPNVCRMYDIGEIEDAPFLSMEYVDGEDLASLLRRIGRLPADKALDIARRLCAGLAAAHEKGVLHRDLKPANIMIDGRGEVLITDFGLAAVAGTVDVAAAGQGTPAYQAPEQLAGREVTVKSDLYALGLVLYEVFTGRRAFEARSLEELARMQRESTPVGVTSLARDADPAVERAILRCLAPDPRQRPASAKAVAASLPGGDPLAAAIAAGETPSPEVVAQAGEGEGLRPAVAIGLLVTVLVGLMAIAAIGDLWGFPVKTPFENSPEALNAMARDMVKRLGYTERPADSAFGFALSLDYLEYAQQHFPLDRIWKQMASARPAPLTFWHRESPQPMNPLTNLWISLNQPGFSSPGMIRMRIDMEGRLLAFEARPAERAPAPAGTPDWRPLFEAARLDSASLQPAPPEWTPAMAFDASAAWTGAWPEAPEIPIRVEAAAWRGKPVSFRIVQPWTRPATGAALNLNVWAVFFVILPYFVLLPTAILLARRNLRLKRGDRTGAIRLALATFALMLAADLMSMHYFWNLDQGWRLFYIGAFCFGQAVFVGVAYLAIEPYVRRRCPRVLISWARLLQIGPRDPQVAADMLAGFALGVLVSVVNSCTDVARVAVAHRVDDFFNVSPLLYSSRQFLGSLLISSSSAITIPMTFVFVFFLVRLALRRDWIAAAAIAVVFGGLQALDSTAPIVDGGTIFCIIGGLMFAMLRFGLPAMTTMFLIVSWMGDIRPMTLDPSRWCFGYSLAMMLLIAALAAWAFRTALAGRPLLRDETLG